MRSSLILFTLLLFTIGVLAQPDKQPDKQPAKQPHKQPDKQPAAGIVHLSGILHGPAEAVSPRLLPRTIDEKQRLMAEADPAAPVTLQVLYGDGHYNDHETTMSLQDQRFQSEVSVPYPVFALLKTGAAESRILLLPGTELKVDLKPDTVQFGGASAGVNALIREFHLGELPWYLRPMMDTNAILKLSAAAFNASVIDSVRQLIRLFDARVDRQTADASIRNLLKQEFRYAHQCYLYDVGRNYMRWVNNPAKDSILQMATGLYPLADGPILRNGFFANMMLGYHLTERQNIAFLQYRQDSVAFKAAVAQTYRMPYDSAVYRINRFGERAAMSWLYARIHLNRVQQEKILFNKVINAYSDVAIGTCLAYFDSLRLHFPNSIYLPLAAGPVERIRTTLAAHAGNQRIRFHSTTDSSLAEIIRPYRGSVVYVDLWGTWCGPCQVEMRSVPALKKRFAGRQVQFVYIDLDEADKVEKWMNYVRFIQLEGEHYRLSRAEFQPLWKEIQTAGGGQQQYPTYLLFDRQGRLVNPNALRPSDAEALYTQLESLL